MPFSTLLFLHGFLPIFLLLYWVTPTKWKNATGILGSVVFYACGAPKFLPVILLMGVSDYFLSHAIARRNALGTEASRKHAKVLLVLGVVLHLGLLGYFKYSNFFVREVNEGILHHFGRHWKWVDVIMPIGISFITFEELSYLIDVYRGDAKPARSLAHYMLFLMFFPHSIAGPIFRWKDLEAQLSGRTQSFLLVREGFARFSVGLAKKVLLADSIAIVADAVFDLPKGQLTFAIGWLGALAYTLQIYFDFSGYSDMAIGLGKMCGFTFKENFDQPYVSASITEFWQRWHISLSRWLRDYLYIPLGGNRRGDNRATINVVIVFALSGIWHGSGWTYLVWGLFHGFFVAMERIAGERRKRVPLVLQHVTTLFLVVIGWVFFRAKTVEAAVDLLVAMAGGGQGDALTLFPAYLHPNFSLAAMAAGAAIICVQVAYKYLPSPEQRKPRAARAFLAHAAGLLLFLAAAVHLTNARVTPLIYFKF
ncbi:MAG: MBOAT family O-acyltransferase [Polyangiaceae bacterium]